MIELDCPSCGRKGSVAREKRNTRFVCRKCHMPFYLNEQDHAIAGDPPDHRDKSEHESSQPQGKSLAELEAMEQKLFQTVIRVGLGIVLVIGLGVLGWMNYKHTGESIGPSASRAAQALASDNLDLLKSIAEPSTEAELLSWVNAVRPRLAKVREKGGWSNPIYDVQTKVQDEDMRMGLTEVELQPVAGVTSNIVPIVWTLDKQKHWKIDGRQTYMMSQNPQ
jgi:hypothetical protein